MTRSTRRILRDPSPLTHLTSPSVAHCVSHDITPHLAVERRSS
jgi:hypothetical protein